MVDAIKRGDKVVTSGGIIGTVSKIELENGNVVVEIAPGVEVKVVKSTISEVMTKTPANKNIKEEKK